MSNSTLDTLQEVHTLLAKYFMQEIEAEKKAEADSIQAERAKLMQEMQYHMLLCEEDKAREIALKIKELEA